MSANPTQETAKISNPNAEAEYTTLREEVLRRIDARQQTLSVTMGLAGAFVGLGWGAGSTVLLMYPLIALFLAISWAQNEVFIKQINAYIRDNLENGAGYQNYSRESKTEIRIWGWPIEVIAIGGVFLLTQVMAIGLGMYRFENASIQWILLILDIAAVVGMGAVVNYIRQKSMM
jgi:hypothetical protein